MSTARKLGLWLFFAAMPLLGAASAVFEHHQADRLLHFIERMIPAVLVIILIVVLYGLSRAVLSVLDELDGASRAAHATLHVNYGKK